MVGNWSGMVRNWGRMVGYWCRMVGYWGRMMGQRSRMVGCRVMGCWGMNRLGVMVRVNIRVMRGNGMD